MIEVVALIYDNPFVLYTIIHFLYFTNNRWRLPYDINLWRYLLPSVEKSSMRDHYSFWWKRGAQRSDGRHCPLGSTRNQVKKAVLAPIYIEEAGAQPTSSSSFVRCCSYIAGAVLRLQAPLLHRLRCLLHPCRAASVDDQETSVQHMTHTAYDQFLNDHSGRRK